MVKPRFEGPVISVQLGDQAPGRRGRLANYEVESRLAYARFRALIGDICEP